jgi:hypothetical protein
VIDPKVVHLRNARADVAVDIEQGLYPPAAGLAILHIIADKLWPPAIIVTRDGAKRANP